MAKATGFRLFLMRSGAKAWDLAERVQGSSDLPMTAEGSAKVSDRLSELGSVRVSTTFTAPDEASRETARALVRACGGRVKALDALRDMPLEIGRAHV